MITADQLVLHAVGDYLLQSNWMAQQKTKQTLPAAAHVLVYTMPFLLLTSSSAALVAIAGSHFVIDRWRLARYVVWAKNWLGPGNCAWWLCKDTGYHHTVPPWLAFWLLIIADNTLHVICNGFALKYL